MSRLSQRYVAYEGNDDSGDSADQDSVYVEDRKCPMCFRRCSKRKPSTKFLVAITDKKPTSAKLCCKPCCCACCTRCCLIRGAIITLSVFTILAIIALLLWLYALPGWIGMYLKATNITFDYVSMSDNLPDGTKSTDSLLMSGVARVGQTFPIDIGLLIHTLEVRPAGAGHQPLIGNLRPRDELMMYHNDGGRFSLPSILEIVNNTAFHDFATKLLLSDHAGLRLTTPASGGRVRLHVPFMPRTGWFIDLDIHDVQLDKEMMLTGCSGFPTSKLEAFTLDDKPSKYKENGLNIRARVRLWSASTANVSDMGVVQLDAYLQSDPHTRLGFLFTDRSLSIVPGVNVIHATGRLISSGEVANKLIERFLSGQATPLLAVSPRANASSDPLFSHFVGGLSLSIVLDGVPYSVLTDAVMLMTLENILKALVALTEKHPKPIALQVQARLRNPFGCTILFTQLQLGITYQGVLVGRGITDIPIKLPPYAQDWSARVNVYVQLNPEVRHEVTEFLKAIVRDGTTYLGLFGNFSFTAGGLHFSPQNYHQPPNIPACLQIPPKAGANPQPCHNRSKPHTFVNPSREFKS